MSRFRVNILNAERLADRLRVQSGQVIEQLIPTIANGGQKVANRAIEGINEGPKTGRVYTQRFARGPSGGVFAYGSRPPHQASAPGEYPAADTGTLARSIYADSEEEVGFSAEGGTEVACYVHAEAEYAAPLEFKPEDKGGRPFLRRAAGEVADGILEDVEAAIKRGLGPDGGRGGAGPAPTAPSSPRGGAPAAAPRAPSGGGSNEGLPGFSAEDLNRAQLEQFNAPQLPAPDSEGDE